MHYLVIISGPGGSGKDTVIDQLLKYPELKLRKLISSTSRHMREGEREEVDYHFLTRERFEHEIETGQLLEYEVMESNHHYYGTNRQELLSQLKETNLICRKMPIGALNLASHLPKQSLTIFIDADNQELESRLLSSNRSLEHTIINRRLKQAEHERETKNQFQHCLTNHDRELSQTVAKIKQIIIDQTRQSR